MSMISLNEIRLIVANSASERHQVFPKEKSIENNQKYYTIRISLIKTLKTYVKKYYQSPDKYYVLYLSITYLDIILSKNKISLSYDKNLKYLCLCCFLLSLKFIGNYNISKRIISNFCRNYKKEYKIFEIQCLMLLEHNLTHTTVYDYLNMINIKENKQFLALCNYYLYQICEDKIYTLYPPFYISIAIFQLVKNSTNNIKKNHYDKYFKDERVKILIRKFNDIINPSIIDDILNGNNDVNHNDYNELKYPNQSKSVNFFTNNNIQNNVVIINTFQNQEDNMDINSMYFLDKNLDKNTPTKISRILTNYYDKNEIKIDKMNKTSTKDNITSLKSFNSINRLFQYNINSNLLHKISSKPTKKYSDNEISSFTKSDKKDYNEKSISIIDSLIRRNNKNSKIQVKSNFIYKPNKLNKNIEPISYNSSINLIKKKDKINKEVDEQEKSKKYIYNNKSSLNFKLVSGISRERLLNLSRNLSKTILKTFDFNN